MTRPVEPQDVHAQLQRLRAADSFAASPQLVSFLDYVVEETLAGRGRDLKGYTIAIDALGRPTDFNPQQDPIVRVEARRLRQAIDAYYRGPGRDDPVIIDMPVGGYAPVFHYAGEGGERPAPAAETPGGDGVPDEPPSGGALRPWQARRFGLAAMAAGLAAALVVAFTLVRDGREGAGELAARISAGHGADLREPRLPVIRVQPFDAFGEPDPPRDIARRIGERLAAALSPFDELRVLGPAAPGPDDMPSEYLLRGRVLRRSDGGMALSVALLAPVSREILMAREYPSFQPEEASQPVADATPEQTAIRALVIDIAQPRGVISADQVARLANDATEEGPCLHAAQLYWRLPSRDRRTKFQECLGNENRIVLPAYLRQAHLAFLALGEYRAAGDPGEETTLDRALAHARFAVSSGPASPRAHQALMAALFMRGQFDEAIKAGERAVLLNPNDMGILGALGARLVKAGRAREGRDKLLESIDTLPTRAPWMDFYLVLSALLLDDRDALLADAATISTETDPLGLIGRMLAAKARGASDQASALARKLIAADPRYATDIRKTLSLRAFAPEALDRLTKELESIMRATGV